MGRRLTVTEGAKYGIHYLRTADGTVRPIVRGGDGPTDEANPLAELIQLVTAAEGELAGLSVEFDADGRATGGELHELHTGLTEGYTAARAGVETDEQVEALRAVVAAVQRVAGEIQARAQAAADAAAAEAQAETDRAAALAALDADVSATLASDDGAGDGTGGDEGNGGDGGGDEGAGAGGNEGEETDEEREAREAAEQEAAGNGGDGGTDADAEAAARQQASARTPSSPASLAALSTIQTNRGRRQATGGQANPAGTSTGDQLARRVVASSSLGMFATGHVYEGQEQLGRTLAQLAGDLQVDAPTDRKHVVGRVAINDAPHIVLASEFSGNDDVDLIGEAVRRSTAYRVERAGKLAKDTKRMVASGGICAPAQPDYAITVVGEGGTPFVDSLPTVVAERPLSYFPAIEISMNDAAGSRPGARPLKGIGTVTAAQDAAGYGGTNFAGVTTAVPAGGHAYKDCVKIDCPAPVTSTPEATYMCTTIGQFQAITFKEYVAAFTNTTAVYHDVYRDERSIAKVVAAAKKIHGSSNTWGTSRDVLTKLRRLADFIRSDRHAPGMTLDVRVPFFAATMIANDLAVSYANGAENLRITPAQALALLAAEEGIMIDTYSVSAGATLGGSPTLLPQQAAGELNDWPEEIRLLVWAEGAVFRSSYGELAFGLRETGMQTNDYSTFQEVFEQTSTRASDIYTLDLAVCENGAQGAAVAVTCNEGP